MSSAYIARLGKHFFVFLITEHPDRCVCVGFGLRSSSAGLVWFFTCVSLSWVTADTTKAACCVGLWYYWRTVPQDTPEIGPGPVPPGKILPCSACLLFADLEIRCWWFFSTVGVPAWHRAAFTAAAAPTRARGLQSRLFLPSEPHWNWIRVLSLSIK